MKSLYKTVDMLNSAAGFYIFKNVEGKVDGFYTKLKEISFCLAQPYR